MKWFVFMCVCVCEKERKTESKRAIPSSSHSCLYLSVMVVPCCLHSTSLGSPMNCSVISANIRAPLESLIFSISLTCRDPRCIVDKSGFRATASWREQCFMGNDSLPCWTVSWAAFLSRGTRPGKERAWPAPEPAPHLDASNFHHPRWHPLLDRARLQRTKHICHWWKKFFFSPKL